MRKFELMLIYLRYKSREVLTKNTKFAVYCFLFILIYTKSLNVIIKRISCKMLVTFHITHCDINYMSVFLKTNDFFL